MFHCNGWTFTWGVAARGGTNVCLRNITAVDIHRSITTHGVTHLCCAPIVFNIILESNPRPLNSPVRIFTGGAPPPPALLHQIESLGFHVTHGYGLTEATGPALACEWQKKWDHLEKGEKAVIKARQGVSIVTMAGVDVVRDSDTLESVPRDGKTMGEIVLKGSGIMKGYYKDREATEKAFKNGWFWTGDVGVIHEDGYVEIKDRSKDVIISGGENISSVEVEAVLYKHPAVAEAAVVAMPHPRWGESPCAFVALKKNVRVSEREVIGHCRRNMPAFMVPKAVRMMEELPKTATGKIQKNELREKAKKLVVVNEDSNNINNNVVHSKKSRSSSVGRRNSNNNRDNVGGYGEHVLAKSRL